METVTVNNIENVTVNVYVTLQGTKAESEKEKTTDTPAKKEKRRTGPKTGSNEKREWLYSAIQDGAVKADKDGTIYRKTADGAWEKVRPSQQGRAIRNTQGDVTGHKGYMVYGLRYAGQYKIVYVHETVYMYHHGLTKYGETVDHINKHKTDNRLSNLRIVSLEDNIRRSYNPDQRPYLSIKRALRAAVLHDYDLGVPATTLAQRYGYASIQGVYTALIKARQERDADLPTAA